MIECQVLAATFRRPRVQGIESATFVQAVVGAAFPSQKKIQRRVSGWFAHMWQQRAWWRMGGVFALGDFTNLLVYVWLTVPPIWT